STRFRCVQPVDSSARPRRAGSKSCRHAVASAARSTISPSEETVVECRVFIGHGRSCNAIPVDPPADSDHISNAWASKLAAVDKVASLLLGGVLELLAAEAEEDVRVHAGTDQHMLRLRHDVLLVVVDL